MRDGRASECKACAIELVMRRYHQPEVKSKITARRKERYSDPEIRAAMLAKLAEYRALPGNAERARERTREWHSIPENRTRHLEWKSAYLSDPEKRRHAHSKSALWRSMHPEAVNSSKAKRRANKRASTGSHTRKEIDALLVVQAHCCANCEDDLRKVKRHLDHWMPLILGGSNGIENLQWLCATCNTRKSKKDPINWLVGLVKASHYPRKLE